ncbi:MAG: ATP-dependent endonuclease [Betaproteobacteria bacterium HGW-Betaproteobacteria-22]|nr:MAG: ATP-dependent endonuclease [Betaproteobacteria bacterium HGW-Betaproteobacteria-22]
MAIIRKLEIKNFRSIQSLNWAPMPGINCLIGPGDSGKSTILDAIDICLGARRNVSFEDTDFYDLNVQELIDISITLGNLPETLLNLDSYGNFLRGFVPETKEIEDEPRAGIETVLTLRLRVSSDLEPSWLLYSERAEKISLERRMGWAERTILSPVRIGNYSNSNLSWTRGSVLNRLTTDRANLGPALAEAARSARANFGDLAAVQLNNTLQAVTSTANELGIPIGEIAKALLDSHSVSISDGAISLHSENGVPLRLLGTGSTRLLIAGLQRRATTDASIALIDEVEYGLEPHRIARLLDSLGAKETSPPLQVFMTSHSPVAIRELSGDQLFIVRRNEFHHVSKVGSSDEVQSTLRTVPEAFLAKSIIVCEGASEVGFARGLDQFWVSQGSKSFFALGGAYVDAKGGSPDQCFERAIALKQLGYRVLVLVDGDKPLNAELVMKFNGPFINWRSPRALEDELFLSLNDTAIDTLVAKAITVFDREMVGEHIRSKSNGQKSLDDIELESLLAPITEETKIILGKASRTKGSGWYKSVTTFQEVAKEIVGPHLDTADQEFQETVNRLRSWMYAS